MLSKEQFDRYLTAFHARDYDTVLAHYAATPKVHFAGITLDGQQAVRDFYAFFHDYVEERIEVDNFASSDTLLAIEARVRLRAKKALAAETLAAHGFPNLVALGEGQRVELPQFIHYHLADGKFLSAVCVLNM